LFRLRFAYSAEFSELGFLPKCAVLPMPVDITDTCARVRYTDYSYSIDIVRLAGNEDNTCVRLVADTESSVGFIDLMPGAYGPSWQLQCYVPDRIIASGTLLELHLNNDTVLDKLFITDAGEIGQMWLSIAGFSYEEFALLSEVGVKHVLVRNEAGKADFRFIFSNRPQEHYETELQGEALLKIAFKSVMDESNVQTIPRRDADPVIPVTPGHAQPAAPTAAGTVTPGDINAPSVFNGQQDTAGDNYEKGTSHQALYNSLKRSPELRRRRFLFLCGMCMVMFMILAVFVAVMIKWKIRLLVGAPGQ
jgi:hypothetical protein